MQFLLLFLEGILTFVSPCLLPLLPLYLSYFAAGQEGKGRPLINVLGFILGFTLVFVLLGAFAGTLGMLLVRYVVAVNLVTGIIVIVFGLSFIGVVRLNFPSLAGRLNAKVRNLNFFSSAFFGIVFSVAWTPCVGAFLGSALMMASMQGGTFNGIVMLLVYAMGLAVPFVASAILLDRMRGAFDFIKRNHRTVNVISGILLIVVGLLMASGLMGRILAWGSSLAF